MLFLVNGKNVRADTTKELEPIPSFTYQKISQFLLHFRRELQMLPTVSSDALIDGRRLVFIYLEP